MATLLLCMHYHLPVCEQVCSKNFAFLIVQRKMIQGLRNGNLGGLAMSSYCETKYP